MAAFQTTLTSTNLSVQAHFYVNHSRDVSKTPSSSLKTTIAVDRDSSIFNIFARISKEPKRRNKSVNGQYHNITCSSTHWAYIYAIFNKIFADCISAKSRDNIRALASYAEAIFFASNSIFILNMIIIGKLMRLTTPKLIFLFSHSFINYPRLEILSN